MHIVILCATNRGHQLAEHLFKIGHEHEFTVFSFRETPWEPDYFDALQEMVNGHGQRFLEARNVAHEKWDEFWKDNTVDLMFMISWRYIVPDTVYRRALRGAYVFHDSLLPKYRGFSPTVWAMINGEKETGVTLFKITDGFDAGEIVDQKAITIDTKETIADVVGKVTLTYLDMVESNFRRLLSQDVQSRAQNHGDATYTCKWTPADALINWNRSSLSIYNLVRATCLPYPGAFTYLDDRKLTVWSAELLPSPRSYVSSVPGRVVQVQPGDGSVVLTGDGTILLKDVQLEGEDVVKASTILNSPSQTLGRGSS